MKRPIIINGIGVAITNQDLMDRTLSIEIPRLNNMRDSEEISQRFNQQQQQFLGGLLTIACSAFELLPKITIDQKEQSRLIEFIRLGKACAKAMGHKPSWFMDAFKTCREEAISRTIDASPVAVAMIAYMEQQHAIIKEPIGKLFDQVSLGRVNPSDTWPRTAKGFADALRRCSPALRFYGIDCRSLGKQGSYVYWQIKKISKDERH